LIIDQGQAFSEVVIWIDKNGDLVDNTTYTAKAEVRKNKSDAEAVLAFDITLGGANGEFVLEKGASEIRAIRGFKRGFWSLEVSPSGNPDLSTADDNIVLLIGTVSFEEEITK